MNVQYAAVFFHYDHLPPAAHAKQFAKQSFSDADKLDASHVLIAGDNELAENKLILRNMKTKEQFDVAMDNLVPELKTIIEKG